MSKYGATRRPPKCGHCAERELGLVPVKIGSRYLKLCGACLKELCSDFGPMGTAVRRTLADRPGGPPEPPRKLGLIRKDSEW